MQCLQRTAALLLLLVCALLAARGSCAKASHTPAGEEEEGSSKSVPALSGEQLVSDVSSCVRTLALRDPALLLLARPRLPRGGPGRGVAWPLLTPSRLLLLPGDWKR
jgi:hypothetical protein